jgi:O-acetyl-ADP-ribose deacetylase (regulator of RNase III)
MIKEVTGDILLTNAKAIAHGVAPHDHFDSGLALELRKNYPSMYKDFRHYCKVFNPKPGGVWTWSGVGGVRIICLTTQDPAPTSNSHPGRATVSNVGHSLKELAKVVKKKNIESLAIPRIATGVGGLDWEDIQPLIKEHLGDLGINVFVYTTFAKDVKADE